MADQDVALRRRPGQDFYNTSKFTLAKLKGSAPPASTLSEDLIAYLDGFSPNVQEILDRFSFRNQIPQLLMPRYSAT